MTIDDIKKLNIPKSSGSYQFYNDKKEIIYVGKAVDLRSRVLSYWREGTTHTPAKYSMMKQIASVAWVETDSEIEALLLESNLIKKHQPQYNVSMRDDKRHVYMKITTEEEWPRIFLTRKLDKSGKYFGPFVSTEAVRETLSVLRKIWPYRSCVHLPKRVCLYYRIGKCPGCCEGKIESQEYKKIVRKIVLFLEGKKGKVVSDIEKEIKQIDGKLKKGENAELLRRQNDLKYQLVNLNKVLANANVLSLVDKYATDVVELAKVLGLSKVPERIEGYDISNIFGRDAVGSMVVFANGEPDKSQYRKFKIKITDEDAGDVWMLHEVLERRLNRSRKSKVESQKSERSEEEGRSKEEVRSMKYEVRSEKEVDGGNPLLRGVPGRAGCVADMGRSEEEVRSMKYEVRDEKEQFKIQNSKLKIAEGWPVPDLIIIDGGKQQLNVAVKLLKKFKLDIPVLSISKGEGLRSAQAPDKIFFPGEAKPLELPLASPALHIIKRVRDEAHRFAIKYHRELRGKRWKKVEVRSKK